MLGIFYWRRLAWEYFVRSLAGAKPLEVNVKIEPQLDHSVLSQFEILSYAGPCVMAVGAFVLMLSCVAVLEHRDRRHTLKRTLKPLKNMVKNASDLTNVLRSSSLKRSDFTADIETTHLTMTPKLSIHTVKPKISITSDVGVENVTFLSDSNNDETNNNVEKLPEEEQECPSTVCQVIDPTILNTFLHDVEDQTGGSFLKHANSDHLLDKNITSSSNVHYLSPEPYEMSEISQPMIRKRVSLTKSDPEKLVHSHQNGVVVREQDDVYCAEDSGPKRSFLSLEPVVIIKNQSVK
uniref:Uncharacterized protein n=1 Tax=Romanomermis culicivorax TaxID=13658 RepID=A0A915JUR8_ROMCU